jgi:ligand-binding sensor domain-containing protein
MFFNFYLRSSILLAFLLQFNVLSAQWVSYKFSNTSEHINNATSISALSSGHVWLGTSDYGLYEFDGSSWNQLAVPAAALFPNTSITNINATLIPFYVSTLFGGLNIYNGSSWRNINTDTLNFPDTETYGAARDSKGNLWVATNSGLAKDSTNSHWYVFNTTNTAALPTDNLYNIYIDAQDAKWLGTSTGEGLIKFKGTSWQVYNTSNSGIPDNNVNRVKKFTDGTMWIATNNGLAQFDGISVWTVYNTANTVGFPGNVVNDIAFDNAGNVFIATNGGLGIFNRSANNWVKHTAPALPENNITGVSLNPTNNQVWVSTATSGVATIPVVSGLDKDLNFDQTHVYSLYPNPASDYSYVSYKLLKNEHVTIYLSDISGNKIVSLMNEFQNEGSYDLKVNLRDLPSGVYICSVQIGDAAGYKRLAVVK